MSVLALLQSKLAVSLHVDLKNYNLVSRVAQCSPNTDGLTLMLNLITLQLVWQRHALQICTVKVPKLRWLQKSHSHSNFQSQMLLVAAFLLLGPFFSPWEHRSCVDTKYIEQDVVHC